MQVGEIRQAIGTNPFGFFIQLVSAGFDSIKESYFACDVNPLTGESEDRAFLWFDMPDLKDHILFVLNRISVGWRLERVDEHMFRVSNSTDGIGHKYLFAFDFKQSQSATPVTVFFGGYRTQDLGLSIEKETFKLFIQHLSVMTGQVYAESTLTVVAVTGGLKYMCHTHKELGEYEAVISRLKGEA